MTSLDVAPASVENVARHILAEAGGPVSTMKLQKLCYFVQGWTLAWTNGIPLFQEDFQAWRNGPVCYELFQRHRGMYAIDRLEIPRVGTELKAWQIDLMNSALKPYLPLTGAQLSGLTHEEDTPWSDARANLSAGAPSQAVISKESILDFFQRLMPTSPSSRQA